MKIISKYKDYYDYLSGIYGVDPLITYNRNPYYYGWNDNKIDGFLNNFDLNNHEPQYRIFYICGKIYGIIFFNNKIYYTFEEQFPLIEEVEMKYSHLRINSDIHDFFKLVYDYSEWKYRYSKSKFTYTIKSTNINEKYNCPVIISNYFGNNLYFNQRLSDYKFNKIISDKDIYLQITDFLSKKEIEMPSDPNDMIRYEEKGFDKKTSFRKM